MKKYTAEEIKLFLKSMDSFATKKYTIIIIGGSAAALAYNVTEATLDIDSYNNINDAADAYKKAKEATGLEIPFSRASVSDGPYNLEDRWITYEPDQFKNLVVKVPEVIDLILMKTVRGYQHDIDAIEQMVKTQNVKISDLTDRYINEMDSDVLVNKSDLNVNFLAVVERCFGDKEAKRVHSLIKNPK